MPLILSLNHHPIMVRMLQVSRRTGGNDSSRMILISGQDETMIAVALGYTCHLVVMISHFLDVPMRYPMEHLGSRSIIRDHILDKLTDKERELVGLFNDASAKASKIIITTAL